MVSPDPDDRTGPGTAEPEASDPADAEASAVPSSNPSTDGGDDEALAELEYDAALDTPDAEVGVTDVGEASATDDAGGEGAALAESEYDAALDTPGAEVGDDRGDDVDDAEVVDEAQGIGEAYNPWPWATRGAVPGDAAEDEDLRLDDDQLAELSYDAGLDELDEGEGTDDAGPGESEGADEGADEAAAHDVGASGAAPAPAPPVDFHELHDMGEGDVIVRVDVWATVAFALVAALAAVFPDALVPVFVPLSLVLFLGGCVAFVWAFARGVARSRFEAITMGGLFFLTDDVAPARIRRALRSIFLVQVVVAVAAALVRPFTPLAFGTLVPTLGLGLIALWAARHGDFPPKPTDD